MPHRTQLVAFLFLLLPTAGAAIVNCPDCVLGLYDDTSLTSNFGVSVPFTPKDIYLSIDLAAPETGITGIEFSIAGLAGTPLIVMGVTPLIPAGVEIGSAPAPADTSAASSGTGGMYVAWWNCLADDRAVLKVRLLPVAPVVNHVLRVMHKFPPSNPAYNLRPVLTRCDSPIFTPVRINGGCYVLNPDGAPTPSCPVGTVAVESRTWTRVKELFR